MKPLFKVVVTVGSFFFATFLIARFTGLFDLAVIESFLTSIKDFSPLILGAVITGLLFADLFIAVPTESLSILSGYLLGFIPGSVAALIGMFSAGMTGYVLSRRYGTAVLEKILKKDDERLEMTTTFERYGFLMILISRALPILPEVSACLAGATKMPFRKLLLAWSISSIPYVLIAAYSGSISSLDDPTPAIVTTIGLTTFFGVAWLLLKKRVAKEAI